MYSIHVHVYMYTSSLLEWDGIKKNTRPCLYTSGTCTGLPDSIALKLTYKCCDDIISIIIIIIIIVNYRGIATV